MKSCARHLPKAAIFTSVMAAGVALASCSSVGTSTHSQTAITANQPAFTAEAADEVLTRGAELYVANCQVCHGGATGGSMMDVPPPHNANGHTWHHPDHQLVQTILNGSGEKGEMMRRMMGAPEDTPPMPAFRSVLTEDDIVAILTYIKTWWTPGQRERQADTSRRYQEALDKQQKQQ